MTRIWNIGAGLLAIMLFGCSQPSVTPRSPGNEPAATNVVTRQTFEVKGVIQELKPSEKKMVIKHEEIPNYMPAMTMPLDVKNTNDFTGLKPGDEVEFTMVVTEDDGWIENVRATGTSNPLAAPKPGERQNVRLVRDVDPLDIGNVMPDYSFTNSLGDKISFSDFKGQAYAFTFIFTRCPFPTFCPRMSSNFEEAYKILQANEQGPTNWHLFSISFDPQYDTPARLKAYSSRYNPDPKKWDWVTGAMIDIDAITEQFGLYFIFNNVASFDHNLRTVVVDATGKIQQIFIGNEWKPQELADEIMTAAKAQPGESAK